MFDGVYSPVLTLMDETGAIDYSSMEKHINRLATAGLDGMLFLGSMGEFYALDTEEKHELIRFVVKTVNKRCSVIIGVGGTNLNEVISLAKFAKDAGADAINIVAPYYFGPTPSAAIEYFGKIAKAVDIPIQLYNFPDRVGTDLTPDVVAALARLYPNIVSIKDTVDNISHTRKIIAAVKPIREDFSVLSGFDEYYLVNRISGGNGTLTGLTNVVPEYFVELNKAYKAKDFDSVEKIANRISVLMGLYECTDLFITGIKAAVQLVGGYGTTYTRAPGTMASSEDISNVKMVLAKVGL